MQRSNGRDHDRHGRFGVIDPLVPDPGSCQSLEKEPRPRSVSRVMRVVDAGTLKAILARQGFEGWSVRLEGRRLRCPHGLLIDLASECPVGCISPLVVIGLVEPGPTDPHS